KLRLAGLFVGSAALAGCKQPLFINECDYKATAIPNLPQHFEQDPYASIHPGPADVPPPPTVGDPDRPPRYISLAECVAVALEQGNIGSQSPVQPGLASDLLVSFAGRGVSGDDSIRVLALDPAISGADIEASVAKFDARWLTSMTWQKNDN